MKRSELPNIVSTIPTAPLFLITPPAPHATVLLCTSEGENNDVETLYDLLFSQHIIPI